MLNNACLVGRVTKDPFYRTTDKGEACGFSLAVDTGKEETSFFDCVAFNGNASIIHNHVNKGDQVGVTGSLRQRKFKAKDGSEKSVIEIVVNTIQLLTPKKKEPEEPSIEDFPPLE